MMRVCFTLQIDPARLDEYRARHDPVWPEMLAEIAASGRRNYSLFLRPDGLLIGYYEVEDAAASEAYLAASEVAGRWEASMAGFFQGLDGRPDQAAEPVPEVFNLAEQLERSRP
ncbi:MAG: L-rhamnose mutarotase [Microbacteriaceae bacterium]